MNTLKDRRKSKKVEFTQDVPDKIGDQKEPAPGTVGSDRENGDDMLKSEMYADNECDGHDNQEENEEFDDMIESTNINYANKCYKKLEKLTIDPMDKRLRRF